MKKIIASFGWLMLLLPLISVAGNKSFLNSINGGFAETETRQVSNFKGVSSGGSFDVFITMGGQESLKLEGDKEDLAKIETVVEDGILKVRFQKKMNSSWFNTHEKVRVYITAKQLDEVSLSGSGNIKVDGTIKSTDFKTKLSGSGNISLAANASTFNAAISGSGGITVSGETKGSSISISGSGDFNGKGLHSQTTDIKISGSGNAKVNVDETLNAAVSGSGNIYYSGKAQVANVKKSGSGSISKM
ncbi:DUF2807 domain-containing protein [Pedobacter sp. HMF7647]|uniref:DUF2807 domain-containing protein n=1 Tax=Hufsiella arboris TaxID=2695275 RepID=A0A7K1YEF3_9SPHI|nr:head GIN domain-containing protein [Hufsiella arboris]MXV52962.1 DUF2807 domain-containing protein [Hufsiella arboris]